MMHRYLEIAEAADRFDFHAVWLTEHHFLEEYCHASAPEVFLAAVAARTKKLRVGHGILQMLPGINHPVRVAERISTLDLLSDGRVEFGTGEGTSRAELEPFHIDALRKRAMWVEGVKVATRCMYESPFTGFDGEFVQFPPRDVVPKPVQRPHPPVWVSCTREETLVMAAENGLGALNFTWAGPEECGRLVRLYYDRFEEAVPLVKEPNPNMLFLPGNLSCAPTREEAKRRIGYTAGWFNFLAVRRLTMPHRPGQMDLWEEYCKIQEGKLPPLSLSEGSEGEGPEQWLARAQAENEAELERLPSVGTPQEILENMLAYEAAGVDEMMFILPPIEHEYLMESIELLGKHVVPVIKERDQRLSAEKAKRMAPVIERARERWVDDAPPLDPEYSFMGAAKGGGGPVDLLKAGENARKSGASDRVHA